MERKLLLPIGLILAAGMLFLMALPAAASPQTQAYYQTPTPGTDGRIVYTVQSGESCLSISLLTGVDITQLKLLNNLDDECLLTPGQELVLGVVELQEPTEGPSPTPTIPLPTPTPFNGTGEICVNLFADMNGNAMAEENEGLIASGAISIVDKKGLVSLTGTTKLDESTCFGDLPEGDYNISVAPPEGFNPTTTMNYPLSLKAGDLSILDFGAQASSAIQTESDGQSGRSSILGIMGGILILAGIGIGIYFGRTLKK